MIDFLNNGKVLIGSQYDKNPLKPKYIEHDRDMLLLQTALIEDVKTIRRHNLYNRLYIFSLVFGVFGAILFSKN
jgi:hypothetical protein